ncbi:MAG: peptidase [Candidatus Latescibacterota bacterium]
MTKKIIKACVDRVLSPEKLLQAAEKAVKENPANTPAFSFSPGVGAAPMPPPYMAMLTGKKWKNGRTLRVRFLDGQPAVQAKVERFAHEWGNFANIKFDFGNDPDGEIRISFEQEGSWSFIGVDATTIPQNEPTMNFGWLQADTPDDEYSRVAIHEFGHALACIHEHQSPGGNIPWDKEAVYRYYMGPPNNWSKSEIDLNLFQRYGQDVTQFTQFDPKSIMLYPIPNEFTIGDYEVGWNRELSAMDKEFVSTIYPKEEKPTVELKIGACPTRAEIGNHGEEDLFKFTVQEAGCHVIQTGGRTDVVMTLFGPDNQIKLIAEDDDSGRWGNVRIGAKLGPGTYYALIRHHRPTGTGKYAISVKAEK